MVPQAPVPEKQSAFSTLCLLCAQLCTFVRSSSTPTFFWVWAAPPKQLTLSHCRPSLDLLLTSFWLWTPIVQSDDGCSTRLMVKSDSISNSASDYNAWYCKIIDFQGLHGRLQIYFSISDLLQTSSRPHFDFGDGHADLENQLFYNTKLSIPMHKLMDNLIMPSNMF